MDISEQYLKMCIAAPGSITTPFSIMDHNTIMEYHMQILYCTKHSRFVGTDPTNCPICGDWRAGGSDECEDLWIRVPRQDNLQNLVIGKIDHWTTGVGGLWGLFCFAQEHDWNSMEQLWLSFVMKKLYNKVWYKEAWVREKT